MGTTLPPHPKPEEFVRYTYSRAIGGTFILSGDYAREHGYIRGRGLGDKKFGPFAHTRCDVTFRRQLEKEGSPVRRADLPNLYRFRHSESVVVNPAHVERGLEELRRAES